MMFCRIKKSLFSLLILIGLFCSPASAKLFGAEEKYLENGLRVIAVQNRKAPIVKMMVWYPVGSIDEPTGKGGLAHLVEHLMFRGTKLFPNTAFNDLVAESGASSNAFTTHDVTAYHEFTDISRLELMMALEADRMRNLKISDQAFETERDIVAQERQQRIMNHSSAIFSEELARLFWKNKDYGRPVSGDLDEIASLTRQDAETFYRRYYVPNRAVLVLAGDLTSAEAFMLAEKYFGKVPADPEPIRVYVPEQPEGRTHIRLQREMTKISTPRVSYQCLTSSFKDNPDEASALNLFVMYLDAGDNSYLNRRLVRSGKTITSGADFDDMNRGQSIFQLYAIPLSADQTSETEVLLHETLRQALKDFDQEALDKEKAKLEAELVYIRDNPENVAMTVGQMASLGLTIDQIETYADRHFAVTLDDVRTAVGKMLDSSRCVTGILLPHPDDIKEKE